MLHPLNFAHLGELVVPMEIQSRRRSILDYSEEYKSVYFLLNENPGTFHLLWDKTWYENDVWGI